MSLVGTHSLRCLWTLSILFLQGPCIPDELVRTGSLTSLVLLGFGWHEASSSRWLGVVI